MAKFAFRPFLLATKEEILSFLRFSFWRIFFPLLQNFFLTNIVFAFLTRRENLRIFDASINFRDANSNFILGRFNRKVSAPIENKTYVRKWCKKLIADYMSFFFRRRVYDIKKLFRAVNCSTAFLTAVQSVLYIFIIVAIVGQQLESLTLLLSIQWEVNEVWPMTQKLWLILRFRLFFFEWNLHFSFRVVNTIRRRK